MSVRGYGQNKIIYILFVSLWDIIKACVQNGISGSYMDAVFDKLVVHEESEIYHTVSPRKAYYNSQVSRVCVGCAYVSRDMSARNGQHD